MERETVDMLEMARNVVQQLSSVARKSGVTLVANGTHGQVQGVRQVLGEMVYNLCENAVKYNRAGGRVWAFSNGFIGWTRATPKRWAVPDWDCLSSSTGQLSTMPRFPSAANRSRARRSH